jgi:hypothetical protein
VGAGLAFDAARERYTRQDFIWLNYHVHIPLPDPMVNPSTVARRTFYGVNSSPSYFFDGEIDGGGGGSADSAKALFESKVDPKIQAHLAVAPEAAIRIQATQTGNTVKAKATVSGVMSKSAKLRVQIVLAEESVTFSGENGERFHPFVVRSMAVDAKAAQGFALAPGKGGSFEYTFDLVKAMADAKESLIAYETKERKGEYTFREKKHEIRNGLVAVAFVQDEATKNVLQATYVKIAPPKAFK